MNHCCSQVNPWVTFWDAQVIILDLHVFGKNLQLTTYIRNKLFEMIYFFHFLELMIFNSKTWCDICYLKYEMGARSDSSSFRVFQMSIFWWIKVLNFILCCYAGQWLTFVHAMRINLYVTLPTLACWGNRLW